MRRLLSPVAAAILILLSTRAALSQEAPSVPTNRVLAVRAPFLSDLSVVGSDGIYYRVRHNFGIVSLPVSPTVVPSPPMSVLEAINPSPDSNDPVDSIAFAGLASQLAIGKDNRLYMVVNVTPPVSIAAGDTTSLVPVPPPQSRLYIIPTPFPPRILRGTLESVAVPVNLQPLQDGMTESQQLETIVQADFDGHAQSLKVKAVRDDLEYVYVSAVIPSYRFPTVTNTGDTGPVLGPIKPKVKLVIFNSNGRKIKEIDSD